MGRSTRSATELSRQQDLQQAGLQSLAIANDQHYLLGLLGQSSGG